MRSTRSAFGFALLLGIPLGCAEAPPPTPAVAEGAAPATVAAPSPAPVVLAPVAEPADIFVQARWKSPNATLSGLSNCAGVPGKLAETNARTLLDKALADAFRGGVDGRQIADLVALDAPVDLVVALDPGRPQALFAFSIGLTSLERAQAALQTGGAALVELAPSLWRVGMKDAGDLSCVIGPAAGSAPARFICGRRDKDVLALGPYLARNLPLTQPPAQDVHAELRFTPIDARYGADIRRGLGLLPNYARMQTIGDPRYDKALEEAASALADEGAALVGDLDRVTLDLGVDASSCLTARTTLQLKGKSSWLAGTIAEGGAKAGPPPALFWRAPVDSDAASYGRGADISRYTGIFRTLRGLVEGKLAHEKIGSEADRRALAALIDLPLGKNTDVIVSSGHGHVQPRQIPPGTKLTEQQLTDEVVNGSLGWTLLGFDEGPDALAKLFKDVVAVYGRKGLLDPVKKELGDDAASLPAAKLVPAPKELGKGALDLEIKFHVDPKRGDKKPVDFALSVLLMPDGKSTWIAIGPNRDDLVKHLLMTRSSAPEGGTLAARPGLEPLRGGKATGSGFFTLSMFTRGLGAVLNNPAIVSQAKGAAQGPLEEMGRTLNNLPHKGETPIFVSSEVTGAASTATAGEFLVNVQKGSFEDIGVLLMTGLRLANNAGLLPAAKP